MAYSDFTLPSVRKAFELTFQEDRTLFEAVPTVTPSDLLNTALKENTTLAVAVNSEKARSEFLIAPILSEVRRQLNYQIGLFSGSEFNVDSHVGLNGYCDFILCRGKEQYFITAPVLTVIEAKNENISGGLGQCIAAMVAAQLFNQQNDTEVDTVYGAVTTGTNWKFLTLTGKTVAIDAGEYYVKEVSKILGILMLPFSEKLQPMAV